jgi:DNA transposition AAA+ family ATPase
MKKIQFNPVFVKTKNVWQFEYMMDGLALGAGEGRLGLVYGRAGRGKTRTSQWYGAHHGCIYLRVATIWRTSELEFLKALYRETAHTDTAPYRKGPCFVEIVDRLLSDPRPVFIDEIEKLPRHFLDLVRDLSDMSTAPFILIGEEELLPCMRRNRRVWSRTFRQLEFMPITEGDIVSYIGEAAGLTISVPVAKILRANSGGDFRIIRRDLLMLIHLANSKGTTEVDEKLARMAVKAGLNGS